MMMNVSIASVLSFFVVGAFAADPGSIEARTKFIIYDNNNKAIFESTDRNDDLTVPLKACLPSKKYALVVHGLGESCDQAWAVELRQNLIKNRGGCIICMDYKAYSGNYFYLLGHFKEIAQVLTDKLNVLKSMSFPSDQAYLFGFSFGSRLIPEAGNRFGQKQIGTIHLCEPAGPGFDGTTTADPQTAAINAQCIHTASGTLGTKERRCSQNWSMGDCGKNQVGQRPFPNGNHGLCPVFYNYAFDNVFPAVEKSQTCKELADSRDLKQLPTDHTIRMGYFESAQDAKNYNGVNLYAVTTRDPPYNK